MKGKLVADEILVTNFPSLEAFPNSREISQMQQKETEFDPKFSSNPTNSTARWVLSQSSPTKSPKKPPEFQILQLHPEKLDQQAKQKPTSQIKNPTGFLPPQILMAIKLTDKWVIRSEPKFLNYLQKQPQEIETPNNNRSFKWIGIGLYLLKVLLGIVKG